MTPSAPKLRQLLALLAVNTGCGVRTDQIIEELWEERPPVSAMTMLQTYVYQLRKLLNLSTESSTSGSGAHGADWAEVPALCTSMGGYVLTLSSAALDSREFEKLAERGRAQLNAGRLEEAVDTLRAALRLWRGPVFSDIGAGPVLRTIAVLLEEARKSSLEQRIEAEMALGHHRELISELSGLVAQQPTSEGFQAKLMLALYRAGRRSDALLVYQRARVALSSELGLEPSSELQLLHRAVLRADAGLDAPSGPRTPIRVARAAPPSHLPPDTSPLAGRDTALDQVRQVLQVPRQSATQVVVVYGRPGSGKSAFCVHAAHALWATYPDGQLFVELVDAAGTRVDTSAALGYCLRAARVSDDHVPVSLEERTRLFRSWTANRRVLVVLDDAISTEQLVPLLLTGSGCAALVACRRLLPGPSIGSIACLEPLGASDAEAMLAEIVGRQRVARMLDRIRPDRQRPHAVLAKELGRHTSVRRTYELMPSAVRATFRVVAAQQVHPATAVTVARALGVDVRSAEELLEDLVEFQLATVERGGDELGDAFGYQVPPILRASAAAPGWGSGHYGAKLVWQSRSRLWRVCLGDLRGVDLLTRPSANSTALGFGPTFVAPLFVGTMLNPINSTMITTALVPIGRSFAAGAAATAWLVAALYLTSAIAQPVMGKLADRRGARRVYVFGLTMVGLAGIGGALAPSLGLLVVIRVLIGIGTSAAYPAAMAMVRAQSRRLGRPVPGGVLGTLSIASLTSATIGPVLGGLLVGQLGWPAIFLANLPLVLVGLWLTLRWLPADEPAPVQEHSVWRALDVPGLTAFGTTLATLLLFLMDLAHPNYWLLAGFVLLAAVVAGWELRAPYPFLDLRMLFRHRRLLATYGRYSLTFLIIYGMLYGFPQWLQEANRLSPKATGLLLLPMSLVAGACTVLGARGRRVRGPLVIGSVSLLVASVALLGVSAGVAVGTLVGVGVLFGIPNGLNVVGNQAAMYAQAPTEDTGAASGLFRTSQYIGAIFSTSLIGLCYGHHATDTGLHQLAMIFIALSVLLLSATVLDRTITRPTHASN